MCPDECIAWGAQGTYIWASGNTYVGQWENDNVHGKGVFTSRVRGHKYTGEFHNNVKQGRGLMEYSDGNTYGPHGGGVPLAWGTRAHGVMAVAGMTVIGSTMNAMARARSPGTLEKSSKKSTLSTRIAVASGKGTNGSSCGCTRYVGDFLHGKRHGFGRYEYHDGEVYEGLWVDGRRHGRVRA